VLVERSSDYAIGVNAADFREVITNALDNFCHGREAAALEALASSVGRDDDPDYRALIESKKPKPKRR
jgi:hypothetical protein